MNDHRIGVLIVEDEFMIAEDISMRLKELGYIITGCAQSFTQAINILKENNTDLVLLDINLGDDRDGIELAKYLNTQYNIPFIFLSSLANKSIMERAKKVRPSAYLLKPFNDRQVQISIEVALANRSDLLKKKELTYKTSELITPCQSDHLYLKEESHFIKVSYLDILWLEAESNYTIFHTLKGDFKYANVLKSFIDKLPSDKFIRVHRSYIVNIDNISGFDGNLLLINDKRIPVNNANKDQLFDRLNIL